MQWWLAYLCMGLAVGFPGLLGIGGGAVMVPILVLVFTAQGLAPDHVMHVALGTAMATIMFTSISSMRAHAAHAAVDWGIARAMAPGILAGSFSAALVAGLISKRPLALMFTGCLVFYAATQILFDLRPRRSRELPGAGGFFAAGYAVQGLRVEDLPSPSLGYVYLPALILVAATSMLAAPLGARVAHRLPVKRLRVIFALLLYALAVRMLVVLW
jgi:uncharacterized membrane protein YfcA